MNEIVLDEGLARQDLFPFTLIRSAADIRIGILTIREKWEQFYGYKISDEPGPGIQSIPSQLIPDAALIQDLKRNLSTEGFVQNYKHRMIEYPWQICGLQFTEAHPPAELRLRLCRTTRIFTFGDPRNRKWSC